MADNTEKLVTLSNLSDNAEEMKRILKQVRAYIDKKDDTKVDKVSGKGLSTNDLTTELLNKLNSLENYDDTAVRNLIKGISSRIDTLVGESATEAIDNFNEILAFLNGVSDTQTLQGLISNLKKALENQIATKANKSHTHAASDITDFTAQVKTLQAADILSAEPTETTLTHTVNGTEVAYQIGELVRVPDSSSTTGYTFYQLNAIEEGKAVWSRVGTGSGGSESNILISTIYIDQTITDPASMISGDINGAAIQAIRANSHRYLGKYTAENTMTICQLLDANSKLFHDSTAADLTGSQGDVFMRLPIFYTQATEIISDLWQIKFAFGGQPEGEGWKQWGDNDLIGVYEAYHSSSKIYSRSDVTPSAVISQANFKTYARNRGTGFTIVKFHHQNIMAFLFYALYGNTNSQAICGSGANSYPKTCGATNYLGMTDTTTANGNSMSINYWGLENWWGDLYEWVDNVSVNPDSINSIFRITENNGFTRDVQGHSTRNSWLWPTKLIIGDYLDTIAKPNSASTGETTGYCDAQYIGNDSTSCVMRRSGYSNDSKGGISHNVGNDSPNTTGPYSGCGSRLAFTGNIIEEDNPETFKSLTAIG